MTTLTELNKISIAIICFYVPASAVALLLCLRHGFGRSSGWLYLILLALIRVVGAALELATINAPTNISLYIGAATLQGLALAPMILCGLGLLTRVISSINHNTLALVTPRNLRFVQILVMVGLILSIVGGTQLAGSIGKLGSGQNGYTVPTESIAGLGVLIGGFGLLVLATAATATQLRSIDAGEKRLLLAVALVIPLTIVRIVFSALGTFGNNPAFKTYGNNPSYATYFLGMAVIMEMLAVIIFEAIGLTLHQIPRGAPAENKPQGGMRLGRINRQQREQRMEEGQQYGYGS